MLDVKDAIDQIWKKYGILGRIENTDIIPAYKMLYKLLQINNAEFLKSVQEFVSANPNLGLKKLDLDYLHEKLTGYGLESLVETSSLEIGADSNDDETNEGGDEGLDGDDNDACQILYSPHKKTPKIVPIFQDGTDYSDVAKNLFNTKKRDEDRDLTRDIFSDKKVTKLTQKSSASETDLNKVLEEKKERIQTLEKVLIELQTYISKLSDYNDQEMHKIKSKYKSQISNCETKINEINESIKKLQEGILPRPPKLSFSKARSVVLASLSLLKLYWLHVLLSVFIGTGYYYFDILLLALIKIQTTITPIWKLAQIQLFSQKDDYPISESTLQEINCLISAIE